MSQPDRDTITTTFTATSVREAKARLERELDTEIVLELRGPTHYQWAAKFARAWGRMVEDNREIIVEVTRAGDVLDSIGTGPEGQTICSWCHKPIKEHMVAVSGFNMHPWCARSAYARVTE